MNPPTAIPRISAIVCTYDRPAILIHAVDSLLAQTLPPADYEIIVVDNKPNAETELAARRGHVRYVREPRAGLSLARNAGVLAARAPIVAFMDDDAIASPDWLQRILAAFASLAPRPACVGGRIHLVYETPRPAWLPDELLGLYGAIDWSASPTPLRPGQWLGGGNIAFDRAALEELGGFSPRLGRTPGTLLGMEEVSLCRRLQGRGRPIYYDPTITVGHRVFAERLSRRWLHRRALWQGISDARAAREELGAARRLWAIALNGGLLAMEAWRLAEAALPLPATRRSVYRQCTVLARAGYLLGALAAARA